MNTQKIIGYALLHSLFALGYIALVVTLMNGLQGALPREDGILAPILFLSLFSLSAAVMAIIVGLRPLLWFLVGKTKEAILLGLATVAFLALIVSALVVLLISGVL